MSFLVKTETIHPHAARIQAHENNGVISWEIPFGIFNLPARNDRWHMDYSYSTAWTFAWPYVYTVIGSSAVGMKQT